jgi:hypothetical protein
LAEQRAGAPGAALESWIRLQALQPEQEEVLEEIERLAQVTGRWEDALQMHERRFRAARPDEKLAIVTHVADLIEHQMGDLARAFRVYLQAFVLQPEEPEIGFHLWRLAGLLHSALGPAEGHTGPDKEEASRPAERPSREESGSFEVSESMELSMEMVLEEQRLVIEPTKKRRGDGTIEDPTLLDTTPTGRAAGIARRPPGPPLIRVATAPPPPPPGLVAPESLSPFAAGAPVVAVRGLAGERGSRGAGRAARRGHLRATPCAAQGFPLTFGEVTTRAHPITPRIGPEYKPND